MALNPEKFYLFRNYQATVSLLCNQVSKGPFSSQNAISSTINSAVSVCSVTMEDSTATLKSGVLIFLIFCIEEYLFPAFSINILVTLQNACEGQGVLMPHSLGFTLASISPSALPA